MIGLNAEQIDSGAVVAATRTDGFGAVVLFEGIVRKDGERGKAVRELHYEACSELAIPEMERIAEEVKARWGPCAISIQHRVGIVAVGEVSVAVAVGSKHRGDAFEACAYAIEQIKRRAAIWKQERYADGTASWLDGVVSGASS
ncbi:MAG: molybdenum cofactor biosynthesis protein MoaE [Candidatus Eremiobacteraeota bacterium]|nr:molybdenum cofactor biosynthesis protein MoaE [Candidatus Eremiobacteraeota bacterium]